MTMELLTPILTLLSLALVCGALLGFIALKFREEGNPRVDEINALLPQTQCGQCGYPGCKPYAQAIAKGGANTIRALARLLDLEVAPLDPVHGREEVRMVALIREAECIGCTKCIQACPVDAILGSAQQMHTVIVNECTGCDLCVAPCPVDCIDMLPLQTTYPLIATPAQELQSPALEQACIRCGYCVDECPANLLPQQLYWFARGRELEKAERHNLFDSIECGACASVCPSHIPLVQYYRTAKAGILDARTKHRMAVHAKERYDFYQERKAGEKALEEQRRAERATTSDAQATIAAAVERVKAKKAAQQPQSPQAPQAQDQQQ